jgi:mono/diheme cytochrome c family protein
MKTTYATPLALLLLATMLFSFKSWQTKPWPVPEKYVKMANPVKSDAEGLKEAKAIWAKHCQSCHGKSGKGDGTKAAQLETEMRDLTDTEIQKQTDGELFYKSYEGRDEMPSFKKKIPEEDDIWLVVNYMRTLK